MKAAVSILQVIIILVISVSLVSLTLNWSIGMLGNSADMTEAKIINKYLEVIL